MYIGILYADILCDMTTFTAKLIIMSTYHLQLINSGMWSLLQTFVTAFLPTAIC